MSKNAEEESIYEKVSEYWFLDHYRVLFVKVDEKTTVVSVDVYRRRWPFDNYDEEICVSENKYCIVYKNIDNHREHINADIEKIVVAGIKTPEGIETVNVRWFITGNISFKDAEKLFYESWKLIGCKGPKNDPWHTYCPEDFDP
ncbi:hypothetical protein Smar_0736 [Staphylothermus marinus F1]|uniref:Uncharacterized protein n=1 Tax=Staphylothermus marinus (strain ATCC 43588 / DSM 3639 / JCM 9404 / F1) TaxID=399550 RepID=A3DMH8_STAMF|nr:hypothetical protein [Staphylothermus marinus]ABN69838.1 hypothetical protein Smar_0736 [Staphylothermus marinus F1]